MGNVITLICLDILSSIIGSFLVNAALKYFVGNHLKVFFVNFVISIELN